MNLLEMLWVFFPKVRKMKRFHDLCSFYCTPHSHSNEIRSQPLNCCDESSITEISCITEVGSRLNTFPPHWFQVMSLPVAFRFTSQQPTPCTCYATKEKYNLLYTHVYMENLTPVFLHIHATLEMPTIFF